MNGGSQFVETLKKLNYPKASKLNGDDFDWLFETVEDRSFLHWFCSTVNKQNLLSEEEIKAFKALKESGKPILDEDALGEVLKTCQSTESKESALLEELDLEKLEEELQALKKTKNLKIQRRNKLQMMGTTSRNSSLRLTGEEQEAAKSLKGTMEMLGAENAKINSELQSLVEEVKQLTVFFTTKSKRSSLSRPPAFLSQLVLDRYLQLEEQNTKTLAAYTKKQFFEGISDLVESSNEENFQLLDISGNLISRESSQAPEGQREEMARLQFAYIASQYQLIQRKSKEQSVRAGLQWMKENQQSLLRLYQMLEGETGKEQLFRTYEGLEQAAQKLRQDVALVKERLAASSQEQSLLTAKMESESDVLRNTNYCGLKQLMLTPQELGETILQLESQLNTLNQLMVEILNDVKGKKKILERNKLQQMERELYLYFFQDEDCLKSIVEELEKKVKALSLGQGDLF
ncbi:UNVERIFIED_CONTAM: hypothetical protein FKN15_058270 [Acipenser sinensis]